MTAFHLWTPPFRQGKTLGSLLRVVGCCLRQEDSRRPVWEFADRIQITRSMLEAHPEACSKHSGKPWLSQPRLADCCAILSFRSPSRPRDRAE